MTRLTKDQRIFILRNYFETKSLKKVKKRFLVNFPNVRLPVNSTILRLVAKFNKNGDVRDEKRSGRRCSALTNEMMEAVHSAVRENPQTSQRRLATRLRISSRNVRRCLKKLKLTPYRLTCLQELLPADHERREHYCRWLIRFLRNHGADAFDKVYYTDEAWFHLAGYVNAQNYRIWSQEKPRVFREKSLHPQKVGVWAAVSRSHIIGPIFFTSTVNAEVYREIVKQFIALLPQDHRYCYFQQDGATAHTARDTMLFLQEFFDDRLISRPLWPPRSPDLSPPDFFLWGCLKDKVFATAPRTLNELRTQITNQINSITQVTLQKVFRNMIVRARACLGADGGHFQHLL